MQPLCDSALTLYCRYLYLGQQWLSFSTSSFFTFGVIYESPWTAAQEPEAVKPVEEEKKVEETNGKPESKAEATKEAPKGIPALAPRKKKAAAAEAAKQAEA